MLFGKLRVWDTEHNNGVLIYLLLAEHAIEIVADRGIDAARRRRQWARMAQRMGAAFREGRFEDGLTQALEEVSALLVAHFPLAEGQADRNELPDAPVVLSSLSAAFFEQHQARGGVRDREVVVAVQAAHRRAQGAAGGQPHQQFHALRAGLSRPARGS